MQTCFFIGHREAPGELYPQILEAAQQCIEKDEHSEFIVGRHGHFDALAARAIRELKRDHPSIRLMLLSPYLPAAEPPEGFNGILVPPNFETVPRRFAIVHANRYAASICNVLVIYAVHPGSNSHNILEYVFSKRRKNMPQLICIDSKIT